MTLPSMLTLFFSMVILAAIPGPGVLIIVSRTLTGGFISGVMASVGILLGDYVFIALAFWGLSALASSFHELFQLIKYAGAIYLIYLGIHILLPETKTNTKPSTTLIKADKTSHTVDVIAGLITTLSNPKAILFYASFFPAFLSSPSSMLDLALLYLIATIAIGSVMLMYVFIAIKGKSMSKNGPFTLALKYISSFTLIGCGLLVATKS